MISNSRMIIISIFEDENEEMFARELDEFGSSKESFHFLLIRNWALFFNANFLIAIILKPIEPLIFQILIWSGRSHSLKNI